MFEHDRARGVLTDERRERVASAALALVDNLAEHVDMLSDDATEEPGNDEPPAQTASAPIQLNEGWRDHPVMCAGGRGNLDDVAASILAGVAGKARDRGSGRVVPGVIYRGLLPSGFRRGSD